MKVISVIEDEEIIEEMRDQLGLWEVKGRPHDLRHHTATYASRSGVPIEIVSNVILRHSNISTTERYLGKISGVEAMKWIDNLCA